MDFAGIGWDIEKNQVLKARVATTYYYIYTSRDIIENQ